MARIEVTTPITRYLDPAGDNNNDGLTAATAWRTREFAWATMQGSVDLCGPAAQVKFSMKDGAEFTDEAAFSGPFVGQRNADQVIFEGNPSNAWNVKVSTHGNAFFAFERASFGVRGVRLKSATGGLLVSMMYSKINYGKIVFDSCPGTYVVASKNGNTSNYVNDLLISFGSASAVLEGSGNGTNVLTASTLQTFGTPVMSSGFATAFECGNVTCHNMAWDLTTGHIIGPQYNVDSFGTIYGSNNPSGGLPGTVGGNVHGNCGIYI